MTGVDWADWAEEMALAWAVWASATFAEAASGVAGVVMAGGFSGVETEDGMEAGEEIEEPVDAPGLTAIEAGREASEPFLTLTPEEGLAACFSAR